MRVSNHETNLLSVINKQVDVAVNNTEALERYRLSTGKDANDSVRILWKSPLIPADPLVMRTDLPADMKAKIRDFFVNYGKGKDAAREMANLKALTYQGFRASDNQQLVPIRQIELAREKAKIELTPPSAVPRSRSSWPSWTPSWPAWASRPPSSNDATRRRRLPVKRRRRVHPIFLFRNPHDPGRAFFPFPAAPPRRCRSCSYGPSCWRCW